MTYTSKSHTFVLSAYKESEYLEDCVSSLCHQNTQTNVLIATATPNAHIEKVAEKYGILVSVNREAPGIASDWNYALSCAKTDLVTIAHQDDVYCKSYTESMLDAVNEVEHPLLFFTNYGELRNGATVDNSTLLKIKRLMLTPLKAPSAHSSRFVRRRILSFGSAICCPSVTMVKSALPLPLFDINFRCNLDWRAWERVSNQEGSFLYDPTIRMYHRIHEESETTALISNNIRSQEDLAMFELFWPRPVAKMINSLYSISQKSNG